MTFTFARIDLHHDPMVRGNLIRFLQSHICIWSLWISTETNLIRRTQSHQSANSLTEVASWIIESAWFIDSLLKRINQIYRRMMKSDHIWFFFLLFPSQEKIQDLLKKTRDLISFFFLSCPTLGLDLEKIEENHPSHGSKIN